MSKKTVILLILDGWGIGRHDITNPIHTAQLPVMRFIQEHYSTGALQASGIAVGLPWEEEGNSEVGHITIGAGRVLYHYFPRIMMAINNGDFFKNPALVHAMAHAAKNHSALHLIGLLSEGNAHASREHLMALIELGRQSHLPKIYLHLWSDGKDSAPHSFISLLATIFLDDTVRLASLAGRYYAMDRDKHKERTIAAYHALMGKGTLVPDAHAYIESHYKRGLSDEFIEPAVIGTVYGGVRDNDAIIFFNFREDGARQIAAPFILPPDLFTGEGFPATSYISLKNIFVATMTQYAEKSAAAVAFPPEKIDHTLGEVLAQNGKFQMRIAETEKYAHITYFFNGLKNTPLPNEYRILIPSQNRAHRDSRPEMMTREIANRVMQATEEGINFIAANIASPDVMAHIGNFDATVAAVRIVDEEVGKIIKTALHRNATIVITADHGNAECMRNAISGTIETKHTKNPVPIYVIGKEFEYPRDHGVIAQSESETIGILADVAPTILELMDIPQPPDMKGESLIKKFI